MKCSLEIRKGAETVLSRELAPGEYAIGRKDGNDIVLADKSISGKHAVITVGKKKIVVTDPGSRNGILLQGKRIQKQSFAKDFSVQLGPFLLHFVLGPAEAAQKARKVKETKKAAKASKSLLATLNPRILVYGVIFCFALFMAVVYYAPLKAGLESGREREALTRGILLARYLGAINQLPLEEKRMDVLRTDPSNKEEGVRYAYVVDPYGKILAPAQEMGKFLKLRKIDKALADPKLRAWDGDDGEKIVFYPIKKFDTLLGAALIGYDLERAVAIQGGGYGGTAMMLFLLSLVVAGLCGFVLLRGFLSPLRALAEDAGVSLKQRQDHVGFKASYAELQTLVEAMNRMLLLIAKSGGADSPVTRGASPQPPQRPAEQAQSMAEPEVPVRSAASVPMADMETTNILGEVAEKTAQPESVAPDMDATIITEKLPDKPEVAEAAVRTADPAPAPAPVSGQGNETAAVVAEVAPTADSASDQSKEEIAETREGAVISSVGLPACHIDLQQYTIVAFNPEFCTFFAGGEKKEGMHMLEAFADPELISAISTLIDDKQPSAESVVSGERSVRVRKEVLSGGGGIALFTFEESVNG